MRVTELERALDGGSPEDVDREVDGLVRDLLDNHLAQPESLRLVERLQEHRKWHQMIRVCEALATREEQLLPELARRYAQALIEVGAWEGADCLLQQRLAGGTAGDQADEMTGLRGRIAKQRYLTCQEPRHLCDALDYYVQASKIEGSDILWHRGNILALRARAMRDGVVVPQCIPSVETVSALIRAELESMGKVLSVFQRCAKVEWHLAEEDHGRAEELARSLAEDYADAFALAGLRRQLIEVWQLPASDPVVVALDSSGFELGAQLDYVVPEPEVLEKILGPQRAVELDTYRKGLTMAKQVCRITDPYNYPRGTGFAIRGSALCSSWGEDIVIVTNHHVLFGTVPLPADRAKARFTAISTGEDCATVERMEVLWTSPVDQLDAVVLSTGAAELPAAVSDSPIRLSGVQPSVGKDDDPFVYVVGHPLGQKLSLSIRGNGLIAANEQKLHYRAPTEKGSSGSPVFDKRWDLVGLHHAGSTQMPALDGSGSSYPANEAINIQAIRAELRAQFG